MYNVVFLIKRNPAMSQAEFSAYWIDQHTPLTAKVPSLLTYRCYTATVPQEGPSPFDGVAILSFADEATYHTALEGTEFKAAIGDSPNFQDLDHTTSFVANEHVIV